MPVFEPPVAYDVPAFYIGGNDRYYPVTRVGQRLGRLMHARARGRTVLKSVDGTYTTVASPTVSQIEAAAVAYIGGHRYEVTSDEAAALTAAGYGAGIS